MMSSRSVIWTLTQRTDPRPPPDLRTSMAEQLRRRIPEVSGGFSLKNTEAALSTERLFTDLPVLRLVPPAPEGSPEPFLAALQGLSRAAGPRQRPGRAPVRQQVDPDFVAAALHHWAHDDGTGSREEDLQNNPVIDDLAEREFLTGEMRQRLREPRGRRPVPSIPRDFCDDGKTGLDLGADRELREARKVCYGVFRAEFPDSALDATNPASWHEKCPQFWLRSDVVVTAEEQADDCDYQAGLLIEEVNLPNRVGPFGPVALTFVRTTARDRSWSYVTYKLADQNAVKVDEGWYLVQRRTGGVSAAVMVKAIEFYGGNAWLDSVCETGLLDGARELLGVDQAAGEGTPSSAGSPTTGPRGRDGVLTGVMDGYLDDCRNRWDQLGTDSLGEVKRGIAEFESRPLRFSWVDSVFGVVNHATSFLSASASRWADVVQQDLPDALARADAVAQADPSTADRATTPAHVVAAAWKTALGVYQVGNDVSRAMLQVLGPGIGKPGSAIVEGLNDLQRSGGLTAFLENCAVTDIPTARTKLLDGARDTPSVPEFDALLNSVVRAHGKRQPTPVDRTAFAQRVWEAGRRAHRHAAGL